MGGVCKGDSDGEQDRRKKSARTCDDPRLAYEYARTSSGAPDEAAGRRVIRRTTLVLRALLLIWLLVCVGVFLLFYLLGLLVGTSLHIAVVVFLLCLAAFVWSSHVRTISGSSWSAHRRDFRRLYRADDRDDGFTAASPILARSCDAAEEKARDPHTAA